MAKPARDGGGGELARGDRARGRESVTSFSKGFVGSGLSRPLSEPSTSRGGDHLAVFRGGGLGLGVGRARKMQRLRGLEDVVV